MSSACANDGFAKDQYLTATFAYANGTSGDSDALVMLTSRAVFRIISTASGGSLNGQASTYDTVINSRAGLFNYNDSANLSISTVGGNSLATAVNLKILGTINDAFNTSGCTFTVHGLLVVRPTQ